MEDGVFPAHESLTVNISKDEYKIYEPFVYNDYLVLIIVKEILL